MEGPSYATLSDEIEEVKDDVTLHIGDMIACQSPKPLWLRICKVQDNLRNVNKMSYEPVVLVIGPYHHGKARLQKMEDLKLRYLQSLLQRTNEIDVNRYVKAMREMEERAQDCYADPISLGRNEFVMMMVLDGCFIVELFIKCLVKESKRDEDDLILGRDWLLRSIQRDLLLCENQLPYFILSKLLEMVLSSEEAYLETFAKNFFYAILGRPSSMHEVFLDVPRINFNHLLSMIYYHWRPSFAKEVHSDPFFEMPDTWIFKFSATELREAGIKFKKAKCFTSPFEIKFNNGVLEIPSLTIDHHTESLFRNLLAYEQQPQQFTYNYICS